MNYVTQCSLAYDKYDNLIKRITKTDERYFVFELNEKAYLFDLTIANSYIDAHDDTISDIDLNRCSMSENHIRFVIKKQVLPIIFDCLS